MIIYEGIVILRYLKQVLKATYERNLQREGTQWQ